MAPDERAPDRDLGLAVRPLEGTSDLVYVRFHGRAERYGTDYSDDILREWAGRIRDWRRRRLDVFGYFNNDAWGHAPKHGLRLRELL